MSIDKAIGVFDSGVGGLTVFSGIRALLPQEDIIYLGDTARVPYGTKSPETVIRYSLHNAEFLIDQGIKALVVACNTASAFSLDILSNHFDIPVIGVIRPGALAAVHDEKSKSILVIGTEGTVNSKAYDRALYELRPHAQVQSVACPLLVTLAEEGRKDGHLVSAILETYLSPFKNEGLDALILGCTHYPLFKKPIEEFFDSKVKIVDSAVETARHLKIALEREGLLKSQQTSVGKNIFYSTDAPARMIQIGPHFLGSPMDQVKQIDLGPFS